ncbi:MAG TPA: multicopper oxidase domain-containing protein [Gemmatimonadaceae bacterium]|nr:multicopper oxidase domain-containing protein [Gemmatimonadaceae bacterium]
MRPFHRCVALLLPSAAIAVLALTELSGSTVIEAAADPSIQPNGNVKSAGDERGGVLYLSLVIDSGQWKPAEDRPAVTVAAFREEGGPLQNPGPMIRVKARSELAVKVRNTLPTSVFLWGFVTRPAPNNAPIRLNSGESREIRFNAGEAGTYSYFARTDSTLRHTRGTDSQLNGVLIVEGSGRRSARFERIFVISLLEIDPDTTASDSMRKAGVWMPAINGRTWPFTERIRVALGDRQQWRWINASDRVHPMHLHGFFFDVDAKGSWGSDTLFPEGERRKAVTEIVFPRGSMDMSWTADRAGNWLMHCHMIPHVMPFWVVPGQPTPEVHTHEQHAEKAMAGLVVGINVKPRTGDVPERPDRVALWRQLRLIVQEGKQRDGKRAVSYIVQRGAEPKSDSVNVPGSPLILRRGEQVAITVVNRLEEPTSVHWHGLEIESYFDGVAGWSGDDVNVAPLIAPGDSFIVRMVPPRTGTYMYHSHMDERDQIVSGAYGPLIVLEPFERWNPEIERTLVIGQYGSDGRKGFLLNGSPTPESLVLKAGTTYRLRIMNIGFAAPQIVTLRRDSATVERWTPVAKDGADLTASHRTPRDARLLIGVGETYDFNYTPETPGTRRLEVATRDTLWSRSTVKVE